MGLLSGGEELSGGEDLWGIWVGSLLLSGGEENGEHGSTEWW